MIHKKYIRLLFLMSTLVLGWANSLFSQSWNPAHAIGTVTGNYNFTPTQTPAQLVEIYPAALPNTGLTYQWEQSATPLSGFAAISGATATSYSITAPLTQTLYFRRKTTNSANQSIYSNTIKLTLVSATWEDINYVREHDINTKSVTTWQAIDAMAIGPKLQTTTYFDGVGRTLQQVDREVVLPVLASDSRSDVVRFAQYDAYGRETKIYLPYASISSLGKYKTNALAEQAQYYTNGYNEASPFSSVSLDNSPLNRVTNVKQPGTAWAASAGNFASYDMNTTADSVPILICDYVQGSSPVYKGMYPANRLYKMIYTDVNGKQVVEFTNMEGKLLLKKVQLEDAVTRPYAGWMCTYTVYDEMGAIRFQLQPEAVRYYAANNWLFTTPNNALVLSEWCFQYHYNNNGKMIWKKAPGAAPLRTLYDARDRLVMTQDGNQAALSIPQWTVVLYDALDRPVITALYNTTKTVTALQADIDNAAATVSLAITNTTNTGGGSITVITNQSPLQSADMNNAAVVTVVKYQFYDHYVFAGVKAFNTAFTNLSAYSTSDPNVMPIAATQRTIHLPTGARVRVLGSAIFLTSTFYYDEQGLQIQTLEDNIKTGAEITTSQFHFSGRLLSTCVDHTTTGTGYTSFKILTKFVHDALGRLSSVQKQFGTNPFETIVNYNYDDFSRLKTKFLDPGYTAGGNSQLESLTYSYNIHGKLTGINKDYALKKSGAYNKWGHFFGMYLGYDNRDNVFTSAQLNGSVAGVLWNTMGDDNQRRYHFTYDNAGRLVNALFTEQPHPGDGWSNSRMDFSITGSGGKITYDLNSNLLNMLHKGVIPGSAAPVNIDNLNYSYTPYSNKLLSVTDQMTTPAVNGLYGDFKDGTNAAGTADYVYDANGNLVTDLNKSVQNLSGTAGTKGISYNYLDKPELIRLTGKGTIRIVYSADGEKLQRTFIPEAGGPSVVTTYINEFVYLDTVAITTTSPIPLGGPGKLAYINFEEGRVRVITPVSTNTGYDAVVLSGNLVLPNNKSGVFDYFVLDYQQNVRMVLTEGTLDFLSTCSMETAREPIEILLFGQPGAANEVKTTRYPKPAAWTNTSLGSSVSRLGNIAAKNLGPNTLQKVMAGDKISASALYYFQSATGGDNPNIANTVLSGLIQSLSGGNVASTVIKNNAAAISSQLGATTGFLNAVKPTGSGGTTPQAYLTMLFFDERFRFIEAADGGVAQQQVAASVTANGGTLALANIKAPKNGYVFVYVSNRSDQDVYFDNMTGSISRGNILEENHYYAYGLRIASISSRRPLADASEGALENEHLYNDKELFDDGGLNWYDYGFRNYDPQIGRFIQLDPLTDYYPFYTPYQFAGCEPIANVDVDGLEPANVLSFMKGLGDASNVSAQLLHAGRYAGQWSVSWAKDGIAYAKIFKTATDAVGTGAKVANIALKTADVVTDFIPIVGGAKDIYQGIRNGNGWQVALGVGSIVLDIFTFGGSSIAKGAVKTAVKTAIRQSAEIAVRESAEVVVKQEAKQVVAKTVAKTVEGPMTFTVTAADIRALNSMKISQAASTVRKAPVKPLKPPLSNAQLVQKSATKAEKAIGGKGPVAGTAKHQYATSLLDRYQSIYGSRGLETNVYFYNKTLGDRGFLDVLDRTHGIIYDFKFGRAVMSPSQAAKYTRNFGLPIQIIRP